jgi:hypothetical protein
MTNREFKTLFNLQRLVSWSRQKWYGDDGLVVVGEEIIMKSRMRKGEAVSHRDRLVVC